MRLIHGILDQLDRSVCSFMLVESDCDEGAVRVETRSWVSGELWSGLLVDCRGGFDSAVR